MPISAAWRFAPRRLRSAAPSPTLGETGIETIVAVRHPKPAEADQTITVVSPCGACREMIWDYDRQARVIVPEATNGPVIVTIGELLPNKYSRERTEL